MKINIAASHRFHLLDLARELENQGHEVRFYSYVPTKRILSFGLSRKANFSLFIYMLPFLALVRITKSYWSNALLINAMDYFLAKFMPPCDIYIALGSVYLESIKAAKRRFGAITILEWGSKHITDQRRILSELPEVKNQPLYFYNRSLKGYELVDYIAISSDHVKQSFIENGIKEDKLIQNPYGVDLIMFRPTELVKDNVFDLIIVGGWSYRKGCDVLTEVCLKYQYRLLHVGSIVDLPFPSHKNMVHFDSVDQKILFNFYEQARVFVLPSREEGLAMVQLQAVVCGLPIVCSKHTGGRDLLQFLEQKKWIVEMEEYSSEELANCINKALKLSKTQTGIRSYSKNLNDKFDWRAYGKRYSLNLERIMDNN